MFAKANPFEESVAAATNENLTSENWELILGVCDKVSRGTPENARDCVGAVIKRFTSRNANVQLYALALSEALVKNCDITVHREISSRAFTTALSKLIHDKTTHESVRKRALELIQVCSLEFSTDSSLGLMNEVYHSLRAEGIQFPNPQKPKKEYIQTEMDKQKEEEELQLALALSLSETENRSTYRQASSSVAKAVTTSTSSEASQNATSALKPKQDAAPKVSRVRALYDFQPTEQGELGFQKGDIIRVIESVYRDWWKGELRGQMGIFPVNYVEKIVDPSPSDLLKEAQMEAEVMGELQNVDRLLDMLSRIDPQKDAFSENEELQNLYNSSLTIRPKLVRLIEKYSLKKDELVALNEKFLHARTMYDRMLGTSLAKYTAPGAHDYSAPQSQSYGTYPQQIQQQQPPQPYTPQQQLPQQGMYTSAPPQENSYQGYQQQPPQQQQSAGYPQGYPPAQASPGSQQQYPSVSQQQPQQQGAPSAYGYPESTSVQQPQQPQPSQSPSTDHVVQQQPQYPLVQPTNTTVSYPSQQAYSTPYPLQQQQQHQSEQVQNYSYGITTPVTPQQQHPQTTAYPQYPPQQPYSGANQAYAQNF
ncbi:hypothetical protein INT45_011587 [Circinella minor]|uniref:Class E vacuolar protein-sorting machinery protein HSE1 n=1 Tax=Circinella minor TaxID=1195481 RepID=A0A8H7RV74_9FUNG|nr:hypothetical protein INT45_011587 [Circinella minor]